MRANTSKAIIIPDAKDIENVHGIYLKTDYVEPESVTGVIADISETTCRNGKSWPTEPELKKGARVYYKNRTINKNNKVHNPLEFTIDGTKYISVEIADILCICEE